MSDDKKWCKLVFKQFQPMHIGAGNYGVINETRIFIPGWTMWGALTNIYGQSRHWTSDDFNKDENQNLFEEISCFYPCFDEKGKTPLLPKFQNGDFYLGNYSEKKFRAKFVDTFVSTAILPVSRMAKDESLHEMDVILQGAKAEFIENEKEKQLYWVGILNIDESKRSDFLKKGLKIIAGGDSRYGLGLMELVDVGEINKDSEIFKNLKYANYLPVNNSSVESRIELVVEAVGYKGSGLQLKNPKYCFVPWHMQEGSDELVKGILVND